MGFEQLRVYQAAALLHTLVIVLIATAPRGHSKEIDNLRRCIKSILNNIAEAFGNEQPGRKRTHLEIAKGSADETRSSLHALVRDGAFDEKSIERPNALAIAIAKMLKSWIDKLPED